MHRADEPRRTRSRQVEHLGRIDEIDPPQERVLRRGKPMKRKVVRLIGWAAVSQIARKAVKELWEYIP